MKKKLLNIALLSVFLIASQILLAQGPPPPSGGGHGAGGNEAAGGGAPIGGGLGILLTLGAAYGGKKLYNWNQQNQKLEE
jgi:hypothetical protein